MSGYLELIFVLKLEELVDGKFYFSNDLSKAQRVVKAKTLESQRKYKWPVLGKSSVNNSCLYSSKDSWPEGRVIWTCMFAPGSGKLEKCHQPEYNFSIWFSEHGDGTYYCSGHTQINQAHQNIKYAVATNMLAYYLMGKLFSERTNHSCA